MTSFTDGFWNMLIFVGSVGGIVVLFLFVKAFSADRRSGDPVESTGHTWDGDLEELNNPLPRWWLNMFYITLLWGVVYLLLYPGVGTHSMLLGWSQVKQYEEEIAAANEIYGPLYERFVSEDIAVVARDTGWASDLAFTPRARALYDGDPPAAFAEALDEAVASGRSAVELPERFTLAGMLAAHESLYESLQESLSI